MELTITHRGSNLNSFDVQDNGQKLLSFTFNSSLNTTRLEYDDNKRMFMIDRGGFLHNKVVLKNEYGITMGYLGHEKWHHRDEGFIQIDQEKLFYLISHDHPPSLIIYKHSKEEPLLVCRLEDDHDHPAAIDKSKSLLTTLAWYLVAHEQTNAIAPAPPRVAFSM